jgi:hypothetical protein
MARCMLGSDLNSQVRHHRHRPGLLGAAIFAAVSEGTKGFIAVTRTRRWMSLPAQTPRYLLGLHAINSCLLSRLASALAYSPSACPAC